LEDIKTKINVKTRPKFAQNRGHQKEGTYEDRELDGRKEFRIKRQKEETGKRISREE
jgi:hypothetical protein